MPVGTLNILCPLNQYYMNTSSTNSSELHCSFIYNYILLKGVIFRLLFVFNSLRGSNSAISPFRQKGRSQLLKVYSLAISAFPKKLKKIYIYIYLF